MRTLVFAFVNLALAAFACACATPHVIVARTAVEEPVAAGVVFSNVHVFDGEQSLGVRDVFVQNGVIQHVAGPGALDEAHAPGARRIDGAGRTLLPGLIDAHAHFESHGERSPGACPRGASPGTKPRGSVAAGAPSQPATLQPVAFLAIARCACESRDVLGLVDISMFAFIAAVSPYEPNGANANVSVAAASVSTSATSAAKKAAAVYDVTPNAESIAPLSIEIITPVEGAPVEPQIFPDKYSDVVDGVLTFRGGPMRNGGAWGEANVVEKKLKIVWRAQTAEGKEPWGGGAGWTGQPAIIRWPKEIVPAMNVKISEKSPAKDDFVEVIQGSLDGKVYFLDLWTGKPTRPPIDTGNLIKGSVSVDPRGVPLLFVGQGLAWKKPIALRVFSLLDRKELFVLKGLDELAPIKWGAFDSSGVLNRLTDTFVVGGENGLLYAIKLNTKFDVAAPALSIAPEVLRYKSVYDKASRSGIENSVSIVRNLAFFAKDGGIIQAVDLRTYSPLWTFQAGDDTDASLTLSLEDGHPMLYTGNELDKRGVLAGKSFLRKIDGLTGEELWSRWLPCEGAVEPKRKEPGLFSTNVVGSGDIDDIVVFMVSRCPKVTVGTLVALDKKTGKDVWRKTMKAPGWSSTTAFKDQDGKTWLLQGDMHGKLHLIDARTGQLVHFVQLEGNVEASPAVFDNRIVVATRSQNIYGIEIR